MPTVQRKIPNQFVRLIFSPNINAPTSVTKILLIASQRIFRIAIPLIDKALKNNRGSRE